jgi:ABC-type multidrug transport system ATPase subunit
MMVNHRISDGSIVSLENLTVCYGKKFALNDVSLHIAPGTVYALLGRNGAGKSSAIRCLLGQQQPTMGQVRVFGHNVWQHRARVMERVGVIPEEPDAPPDMTVQQIVAFCAQLYLQWDAKSVFARLEKTRVPLQVPFGRLSKGQKNQVSLALALGNNPELLVLDDPTLGLDAVARKYFFEELVGDLADRGCTVFITTHDLAGIEGIADRIGILKQGKLVVDDSVETLKAKFRRIRYAGSQNLPQLSYPNQWNMLDAVQLKVSNWAVEAVVANFTDHSFDNFRQASLGIDPEVSPMSLEDIFTVITADGEV